MATTTTVGTLQKAIAAHADWKARLRRAISNGHCDLDVNTVKADNKCDFGKWLYGPELTGSEKQSESFRTVKQLHAQFHQEAAKVIELVNQGQGDAARKSVEMGGSYAVASTALTAAMIKWRGAL